MTDLTANPGGELVAVRHADQAPETAEPNPNPNPNPNLEPHPAPTAQTESARGRAHGRAYARVARARERFQTLAHETFQLPDIWTDRRPSLLDVARHAWYGTWAGEWPGGEGIGPGRRLGQVYAVVVSIPVHFVLYVALWIVERPSRAALAAVAFVLLLITPAAVVVHVPAGLLSDLADVFAGTNR